MINIPEVDIKIGDDVYPLRFDQVKDICDRTIPIDEYTNWEFDLDAYVEALEQTEWHTQLIAYKHAFHNSNIGLMESHDPNCDEYTEWFYQLIKSSLK